MSATKCPKTGKAHFWLVQGGPVPHRTPGDYRVAAPLWRRCRECGEVDRETHLCEGQYGTPQGAWSTFNTCGKGASLSSEAVPSLFGFGPPDGVIHWYRGTHHPDAVKARRDKASDKWAAEQKTQTARWAREARDREMGKMAESLLGTLIELGDWSSSNRDLVDADEWLSRICAMAHDQRSAIEALMEESK